MRIGFVGYGNMTRALAPRFHAAGHEVFLGGHNPDKAAAAAGEIDPGVGSGDTAAAVAFGEVVVMATPHDKVFEAIDAAGGPAAFNGKVLIDINNPVPNYADGDFTVATYDGRSLSEAIAERLPDAEIAKAFNCCQAAVWTMDPPEFDGRRLVTFTCASDDRARRVVKELVEATGSEPLDLGDLTCARRLESLAGIVIQLLITGSDPHTVVNLIRPDDAKD